MRGWWRVQRKLLLVAEACGCSELRQRRPSMRVRRWRDERSGAQDAREARTSFGLSAQMLEIDRARISSFSHSVRAVASHVASATSLRVRVLPISGARAVAATYSELGMSVALSRRTKLMCPAQHQFWVELGRLRARRKSGRKADDDELLASTPPP